MLKGIDISHYQSDLLKHPQGHALLKEQDFVIAKATEGKSWTDSYFVEFADFCVSNNILLGAYHYARPENNAPRVEAENFVSIVKPYTDMNACLLALDWEQEAHKYSPEWAYTWCDVVYSMTGVRPVVYCNASRVARMKPFANSNYGLWLAHWDNDVDVNDSCDPWDFAALKQYVVKPVEPFNKIDHDVFYGTRTQFHKYQISNPLPNDDTAVVNTKHQLKEIIDNVIADLQTLKELM